MQLLHYTKAMADETRLRLTFLLREHELNVSEILKVMGMGQSRISRHLKILAESGLLQCRRDGLWAFYKAVDSGPAAAFLEAAVKVAHNEPLIASDLRAASQVLRERTESTKRFFDDIAQDWDTLNREVLGSLDLRKEIVSRMKPVKVAADLGCGPGILLEGLAGKAERAIGVDNSQRMLEQAERRFGDNDRISLRIGELRHLPLKDWETDFSVLSLVLHHLPKPLEALRETARVLKYEGRLMVADFVKHDNESMRSEYGDRWLGFDPGQLKDWLDRARFEVVSETVFDVNKGLHVILLEAVKK